jgi:flotillin
MPWYIYAAVAVAAVAVLVLVFRAIWKVAEPNEALIISGLGARGENSDTAESLGFKIVTGKGKLVIPGFQTARRLLLDSRSATLQVGCVTKQGIPVHVRGVVIYKVGDDFASIANAARRFLDQQNTMDSKIHELFAGHLRSIIGNLTVEDLILNRERLASEIRGSSADEMSKLGLVVDSFQIQEIDDTTDYITNLGKPHAAAVAAQARIAEAQRDQEATKAEQDAAAGKAGAVRESQIKQAQYQAEVDQAAAKARQSGPLAEASARQDVIRAETEAAELAAQLAEQKLQSDVRKPADARAYETRTIADADRDARISAAQAEAKETELRAQAQAQATRTTGEADAAAAQARGLAHAEAAKAQGLAEAEAIKARAAALAENPDAVVAQQLAENWPQIVGEGAKAFGNVDHMVVLNGADGVSDLLAKALTMGGTGLGLARNLLNAMEGQPNTAANGGRTGNGHVTSVEPTALPDLPEVDTKP